MDFFLLAPDHAFTLDGGVASELSLQKKNAHVNLPIPKKFTANVANMASPETSTPLAVQSALT